MFLYFTRMKFSCYLNFILIQDGSDVPRVTIFIRNKMQCRTASCADTFHLFIEFRHT